MQMLGSLISGTQSYDTLKDAWKNEVEKTKI